MSLLKPMIRPSRADRHICHLYRARRRLQPLQERYFSQTGPVGSPPAPGAAEAEVQSARKYCVDLLAYAFTFSDYSNSNGLWLIGFVSGG